MRVPRKLKARCSGLDIIRSSAFSVYIQFMVLFSTNLISFLAMSVPVSFAAFLGHLI